MNKVFVGYSLAFIKNLDRNWAEINDICSTTKHIVDTFENLKYRGFSYCQWRFGSNYDDVTKKDVLWLFWGRCWGPGALACYQNYRRFLISVPLRRLIRTRLCSFQIVLLHTMVGTPGMWMKKENTVFLSAAGKVPYEWSIWLKTKSFQRLWKNVMNGCTLSTKQFLRQASTERIEAWENSLPQFWNWFTCQVPEKVRLRNFRLAQGITGNGYRRIRGFRTWLSILSLVMKKSGDDRVFGGDKVKRRVKPSFYSWELHGWSTEKRQDNFLVTVKQLKLNQQ
jgi:hypothetical protein